MNNQEQLLTAVLDALAIDGQTQNRLAKQIGVAPATLDNVKNERWEKISDAMSAKLRAYFQIQSGWGLRSTYNYQVITKLCSDAMQNHRFLASAGFTGSGKTTAAKWFAGQHADAFYVLATVLDSRKGFLAKIQKSMGIDQGGSIAGMMSAIVTRLRSCPHPLLLIDDGGKLNDGCLRLLQIIYDETEFNAGMVILGTEQLKRHIDKKAAKDTMGFRELKRRIAYWQPLRRPTQSIIAAMCEPYGITDKGSIRYIFDNAKDYGSIRNLIENAVRAADKSALSVTREVLADLTVGEAAWEAVRA